MKRIYALITFIICTAILFLYNASGFMGAYSPDGLFASELLQNFFIIMSLLLITCAGTLLLSVNKTVKSHAYLSKLHTSISDNSSMGLCILDGEGRIEYINKRYAEIMDITVRYPLGMHIQNLLNSDALEHTCFSKEGNLEEKSGYVSITANGQTKYIFYHHFAFFNNKDEVKLINMVDDHSKLKTLTDTMNKQMKEINYYSKAKDTFIANVSHEIRTPINAILGMSYYLKRTELSAEQGKLVKNIEKSSDLLLNTVDDVLDLSRMKSSRFTLYPAEFRLADLLEELETIFMSRAENKGLTWKRAFCFDPNLMISADRSRLSRVLTNLLTNAYKFTENGFVSLTVTTSSLVEGKTKLTFDVEDSGIGIKSQDIPRLFQEFEQLENHLTKQHQGSGLGLAICKKIISAMNGRIYVDSKENRGSHFTVEITVPSHIAKGSSQTKKNPLDVRIPPTSAPIRVLVVEDVEINAQVTTQLLEDKGIISELAEDGLEAVNLCRNRPKDYYDLIVMDIHMPRMDGYTASSIIKNEGLAHCPIIALTATEVDEEVKETYKGIITDFLLKPFKVDYFYTIIISYLNINEEVLDEYEDPFSSRDEAIKNLGGLAELYEKHLQKFKVNYKDSCIKIEEFLQEENKDEAFRLAHSIKGLAATLGMTYLSESAAKLEEIIKDENEEKLPLALKSFKQRLKSVCGE